MDPNDPHVKWIKEPELGFWGKTYLPLIAEGITTTVRHLFSPKITVQFPEERPTIPPNYRGVHRLNRRLQIFDRTGPGVDHPVYSNCLESRYLKLLWARVA